MILESIYFGVVIEMWTYINVFSGVTIHEAFAGLAGIACNSVDDSFCHSLSKSLISMSYRIFH